MEEGLTADESSMLESPLVEAGEELDVSLGETGRSLSVETVLVTIREEVVGT